MLATASTMPDGSQETADLRIGVLGPLLARRDGAPVLLGGPGQRALFGLLAVQPGAAIHREAIADVLWGAGSPPPGGIAVIQSYVSRLRGLLEPGRTARSRSGLLASDGPYYRLDPAPGTELDLLAFRGLTAAARRPATRTPRSGRTSRPWRCGGACRWPTSSCCTGTRRWSRWRTSERWRSWPTPTSRRPAAGTTWSCRICGRWPRGTRWTRRRRRG